MSEIIIGIDLGTTNSCVAIKGSNPDSYTPKDLKGYSVIMDRLERKFTPSVLYYNGSNDFEIGHTAKNCVDGKYPPVMFAKRHLGTDRKFQIDDDKFIDPVEVSAEILKYLKAMAEKSVGRKINKAVVTVPAYFGLTQKTLTKEAMERAGFLVDDDRYIIIEPVAAALTYTQMVDESSHKIMVYDLGGGTFDITILKKEGDFIEVVGFGGDHALGGYDFDRLLADHIIEKLQGKGYELNLETEKNMEDKIRYTKLMLQVEKAKIALSDDMEYKIRKPAIFEDQKGASIDLDMAIDRPTFESLIREKIDYTIDLCKETLQKSSYDIEQIDHVIMVGGSSYIPLVKKRLQEEFGKEPIYVEPDLCVAIGASIQAAKFGIVVEDKLRIKFDMIPAVTMFDQADISGVVSTLDGKPLEPGYTVEISNHLGSYKENAPLEGECGFVFEVPVQENSENIYIIRVLNADGACDVEAELKITHVEDAEVPQVNDQFVATKLSKSIYVKKEGGKNEELAREGVNLPFEKKEAYKLVKRGEIEAGDELDLNIELYEGDLFLGEVNVTGIPGYIEENDVVLVSIKILPDYKIIASAYIPSVGLEGKSVFAMNIEEVKGKDELLEDLHKLENDWEALKLLLNREDLAKAGVRVDRAFKRAQDYLSGNDPDTTEASKTIAGLKQLLRDLRGKGALVLRPSKEKFKKLCDEVRQLIKEASSKSKQAADLDMEHSLDAVIQQANQFYELRDQENWTNAYRQVEELAARAYQFLQPSGGGDVDPEKLLLELMMMMNGLRNEANEQQGHPKQANWMQKIKAIQEELKQLGNSAQGDELLRGIRKIYQQKVSPLRDEIQGGTGRLSVGLEIK